jgi:hypothetical protein
MKNKELDQLKKEYMNIHIPVELDSVVKKALKGSRINSMNSKHNFIRMKIAAASIAAALVVLTVGVNFSPVFASTLSKVPVIGSIIKVITFREYTVNEERFHADIKVPSIQGMDNKALENSLNEKYLAENKKLYEQFEADMNELKKKGDGHIGVDSGYVVKTDNENILSVGRYVVNTVGSSSTTFKYDTIDKKREILITLPSLFKDDSYVSVISANIISQMKEQMKSQEGVIYWTEGNPDAQFLQPSELFKEISLEQNFYINKDNKLVIAFNKYDVGPGVMGTPEFVIPTDVISNILVSSEYIK